MTTQTVATTTATDNKTATVTKTGTGTGTNKLNGITLSAFRVVVAFLFLCHGLQGFGAFGGIDGAGGAVAFGTLGWWASTIETVTAILVFSGVFTRVAALLASGTMAYAYFSVHQAVALLPLQNMGEQAALYSWIFLLIAVLGPGSLTVATIVRRRR
jgi:putative oxidoreductase